MYRVEININKVRLEEVFVDLQLTENKPKIIANAQDVAKFKNSKGFNGESWGHYIVSKNTVVLQTLPHTFVRLPLHQLVPLVRETVLHELRHAYQYFHWPEERKARMWDGPYHKRDMEVDARKWAYAERERADRKDLVEVRRIPQGKAVKLP